jgi:pilus assembly protein CpaB
MTPPRPGAQTTTKIFMQNVKVLAVGQEVEANDQARMHANPATVATLLVSPTDAERLALASAQGRLLLTLRSWTDSVAVNTEGALPEDLVGEGPAPAARAPEAGAGAARPAVAARGRGRGKQVAAAAPPTLPSEQPKRDVVEILRGDRFEQRNFTKGDGR